VLLEDSGALVTNPVLVARIAFVVLCKGAINSDCSVELVTSLPMDVLPEEISKKSKEGSKFNSRSLDGSVPWSAFRPVVGTKLGISGESDEPN
jgi:hypothetical protein